MLDVERGMFAACVSPQVEFVGDRGFGWLLCDAFFVVSIDTASLLGNGVGDLETCFGGQQQQPS